MTTETLPIEPHPDTWCIHFNGVQNGQCRAGVAYESVKDHSERPFKLPCILGSRAATQCTSLRQPTPEQVEAFERESQAIIKKFADAMTVNAICPRCDKPLEWERQIGRSVYGSCGCRLWQGKARSAKKLAELRTNTQQETTP